LTRLGSPPLFAVAAADAIADYIRLLDRSVKTYFDLLPERVNALRAVGQIYGKAYSEGKILI
jgi:hypothetical protein